MGDNGDPDAEEPTSFFDDIINAKMTSIDDFYGGGPSSSNSSQRARPSSLSNEHGKRKIRKKKDDDEESYASDESESQSSEDDLSDVSEDYTPRSRAAKGKLKTYNEKQLALNERKKPVAHLHQSRAGRGRPRGPASFRTPVMTSSKHHVEQERHALDDPESLESERAVFNSILPYFTQPQPSEEQRKFTSRIYELDAIRNASGGFRLMIESLKDETTLALWCDVQGKHTFPAQSDEVVQVAQMLRHVWNALTSEVRRSWEMEARKRARINHHLLVEQQQQLPEEEKLKLKAEANAQRIFEMMVAESEQDKTCKSGSGKTDYNQDCADDQTVSMPLSEFPYTADKRTDHGRAMKRSQIHPDCCSKSTSWDNFVDVQHHMLTSHYTAIFYACNFCLTMFMSVDRLMAHSCPQFDELRLSRITAGKVEPIDMKVAHLFLACSDCGLWLPIRISLKGSKFEAAWSFLGAIVKYHTCRNLVPVLVNMHGEIKSPVVDARLTFEYLPDNFLRNFPMECVECGIEHSGPDEADRHIVEHHSDKAISCICGEVFGTAAHFRSHGYNKHLNESMAFAEYLRHSCTYMPPHLTSAPPRVGTDVENCAMLGGSSSCYTEIDRAHDYVDHCRPLLRDKLCNAVIIGTPNWEDQTATDDEGCDPSQFRPDVGCEGASYDFQNESAEVAALKKQLNTLFGKQMELSDQLDWRFEIVDSHSIQDKLNLDTICSDDMAKRLSMPESKFAADLVAQFSRTVKLTMVGCVDMLSGGMFNREYYICTVCSIIVPDGVFSRSHTCSSDKIFKVYSALSGTNGVARCHLCEQSVCSIAALRKHYLSTHLMVVNMPPGYKQTVPGEPPVSLLENKNCMSDRRTRVARATDIALNMECLKGKLETIPLAMRKVQIQTNHLIRPRPADSHVRVNVAYPTSDVSLNRITFEIPQPSSQFESASKHQIYSVKKFQGVLHFTCRLCPVRVRCETLQPFADHWRLRHCAICRGCGVAFTSGEALRKHNSSNLDLCPNTFNAAPAGQLIAKCGTCDLQLDLPRIYNHTFEAHLSNLTFGAENGIVYPTVRNVCFAPGYSIPKPKNDLRTRRSPVPIRNVPRTNAQSLHDGNVEAVTTLNGTEEDTPKVEAFNFYDPPSLVELECYLCGMEFFSETMRDIHLSMHTERWDECPFCYSGSVSIQSHKNMEDHLKSVHFLPEEGVCAICKLSVGVDKIASHLIYECLQSRRCALCPASVALMNSSTLMTHRRDCHVREKNRFSCSECTMPFHHVRSFRAHVCRHQDLSYTCACANGQVYPTRAALYQHFEVHLDLHAIRCRLCAVSFQQVGSLRQHRAAHCVLFGNPQSKRMRILDGSLVMQELNSEQIASITLEEDKRCDLREKEKFKMDIDDVMTELLREVCKNMGETFVSPSTTPPECSGTGLLSSLNASVRLESGDGDTVGGFGEPGYMDDEDDVEIVMRGNELPSDDMIDDRSRAPIVRPIVDDAGDDDLMVVAEVENPSGTLPSSLCSSTRVKTHKCDSCSLSFCTSVALTDHVKKDHQHDAGGTLVDEVYGVPTTGQFWICRVCCAVFENRQAFSYHLAAHGTTSSISCPDCSGVAYNSQIFRQHQCAHSSGKLMYGCGQCRTMFHSEAILMCHLNAAHGVALLFFCKVCCITSYSFKAMYTHLANGYACQKARIAKKYTVQNSIGVCPASQVHYQPKDPGQHDKMLTHCRDMGVAPECVVPSLCVHRSFLTPTDALMACKDCYCTMTMPSFTAIEAYKNNANPNLTMSLDPNKLYPFTVNGAPTVATNSPTSYPRLTAENARRTITLPKTTPGSSSTIRSNWTSVSAINAALTASNNRDRMHSTPNASQSRGSTFTLLPQRNAPLSLKRSAANAQSITEVVTLEDSTGTVEPPPKRIPPQNQNADHLVVDNISTVDVTTPADRNKHCKVCNVIMDQASVVKLHNMHNNGKNWFCLDCANGHRTEVDAIKHFYSTHVQAALDKYGDDFRPLKYDLRCPFPSCKTGGPVLATLSSLKQHIGKMHCAEAPYISEVCATRFVTKDAQLKHDEDHHQFEEVNGFEGQCCPLCGIANQWNVQNESRFNISHMATHGLRKFSMCRHCFTCFENDSNFNRLKEHFVNSHCKRDGSNIMCTACNQMVTERDMLDHVSTHHLVQGYKARELGGQLIVRASTKTQRYYGLHHMDGYESDGAPENHPISHG